ncbi:hypothetical protein Pla175_26060 [Pirellulimonas nuda]|uniref:Peptidase M10 metallopeptidase domain-containing protein n=1 Tax=Pirellulimonas nuda TaxID=2528009 RepID=A0A518DCM3_9BACT|nr:hypothetical protein [Pirellulimonas nuda]QDU89219.1 hypothetical protein Pla175_26060 [Pirellulimonas nuda]
MKPAPSPLSQAAWTLAAASILLLCAPTASAIDIVLDYTLDAQNENWFDATTPAGAARRAAVDTAAAFLSAIITNDDWAAVSVSNESFTLSDIAASTIRGLNGAVLIGVPESDGAGYSYGGAGNDIDVTNRSSVGANEYLVYVGAHAFDAGSTANANGVWDSNDRRNDAGRSGAQFNTWGGRINFNTAKTWYAGSNPGVDPTGVYGVQDNNKSPPSDSGADNWDWSTSSGTWKGFQLATIDPAATGLRDLYATAVHELMHALGATTSTIVDYVGVDAGGDFIGANLLAAYGGPVPGDGGHFAANTQSIVWGSDDIVSETVLDPDSLAGVRKYLTEVDAALLRDLGYEVLDRFPAPLLAGDYNGDGAVDAADYSVWRDNLGLAVTLPGDPTPGVVSADDYPVWREAFGDPQSVADLVRASSAEPAAVPEPAGYAMLAIAAAATFLCRRLGLPVRGVESPGLLG